MGHSQPLFLYFRLFYLNVQLVDKILPMLRFEPRISVFGRDRSTNWATTTACNNTSLVNRLNRNVVVSEDSNLVLFWWSTNGQEVFPGAPHLKDEDRANIMIFGFSGSDLRRIGFTRTNTDPIAIRFFSTAVDNAKSSHHLKLQERKSNRSTSLEHFLVLSNFLQFYHTKCEDAWQGRWHFLKKILLHF